MAAELAEEMQETITVYEDGKPRKITKQRAVLKALVAAAIGGDIRAINAVVACTRNFGTGDETAPAQAHEAEKTDHFDIISAFVERERRRRQRDSNEEADPLPDP